MNREGEPLSSVFNAYISFFFSGNTPRPSLETPQEAWGDEQDTVPAMRPVRIPGLPSRVVRFSEITS